jgi:hypothetical protein
MAMATPIERECKLGNNVITSSSPLVDSHTSQALDA